MNDSVPQRNVSQAALIQIPGDQPWFPPASLVQRAKDAEQKAKITEQGQEKVTIATQIIKEADEKNQSLKQAADQLEAQVRNLTQQTRVASEAVDQCIRLIDKNQPRFEARDWAQYQELRAKFQTVTALPGHLDVAVKDAAAMRVRIDEQRTAWASPENSHYKIQ